ncbi:MAG: SWIM zinc finger family protein [Thermomicrobiales bacterium]|nr:SWIM zinc finger family protein [Thermomicrobiales bacterium]
MPSLKWGVEPLPLVRDTTLPSHPRQETPPCPAPVPNHRPQRETIHAESGLAPLTREGIEARTDAGSFKRGQGYARSGRIFGAFRRERTLRARCHGSSGGPYLVEATLALPDQPKAKNPVSYACDCPRGGFCKHVVALLLTWVEQPERFEVRAPISDALAERSRDELVALIEAMVRDVPELEPLLDLPISIAGAAGAAPVNEAAIRRQIGAALRDDGGYGRRGWYDYDDYYGAASRIAGNLERIAALADDYADAGDWRNLFLVEAILVEELAPHLTTMYDESGGFSGLLANADERLAACLDAQGSLSEEEQRSPGERRQLLDALFTIWQASIDAGGLDLANEGPEAIARGATSEEQRHIGDRIREAMTSASDVDLWTHSWQSRTAIGFLSLLHGEAGLSDEELLAEYRNAELWEEAAESLLKMHRVEEAIALAARRGHAADDFRQSPDRDGRSATNRAGDPPGRRHALGAEGAERAG